jgi:CheY-like chemotaxis protein
VTTVLVVDDDQDIRWLTKTILGGRFDVVEAASGVAALDVLRGGEPIEVVILDVQMPELDGWDTLAAIRGDPEWSRLPVVLCSVKSEAPDARRAWRLGCDALIGKPFAIDELESAVIEVLERSESDRVRQREVALAALDEQDPERETSR